MLQQATSQSHVGLDQLRAPSSVLLSMQRQYGREASMSRVLATRWEGSPIDGTGGRQRSIVDQRQSQRVFRWLNGGAKS